MTRVAGIDGYGRGRWVAVVLDEDRYASALIGPSLAVLLPRLADCAVIGIDIPIGLPDGAQPRAADLLARRFLGRRASTVFVTPPRAVLEARTFADAKQVAIELSGKAISMQAYGIRARILEAEPFARSDPRVREVHPEVSFAVLAGAPVPVAKDSWAGAPLRRRLLARAGIDLPDDIGEANGVPVDDVLDAAIAAWSARRIVQGESLVLPDPPETHADGLPAAIWA